MGQHPWRLAWAVALTALVAPPAPAQMVDPDPLPPGVLRQLFVPAFRHAKSVESMAVTDGGKRLITVSGEGALLWDVATGKRLKALVAGDVRCMAVAPAGNLLAVANSRGAVAVHELATGKERFVKNHNDYVFGLAFSPDGATLASAGGDAQIRLWKIANGFALGTLTGHKDTVLDVVFHPGGKLLYSLGVDRALIEWDLTTGQETRRLTEPAPWWATALALSADGKTLALSLSSGSAQPLEDRLTHLRLFDMTTLKERFRAVLPAAWVSSVALSPDGRYLAAGCLLARVEEGHVRMWDTATGKKTALKPGNAQGVLCVRFLGDGTALASAGDDKMVRLWDVPPGVEREITKGQAMPATILAFSPAGDVLAMASQDGPVRLWNTVKGTLSHKHEEMINAMAFSPDLALVLCKGDDAARFPAHLWNLQTGERVHTFHPVMSCAAFAPDGKTLATAGDKNEVRLWDVAKGTHLRHLTGHDAGVISIVFSPDGLLLAVADNAYTLRLWHVASGNCLLKLPLDGPNMELTTGLPLRRPAPLFWFSQDGALLFVFRWRSGTVDAFEPVTGQRVSGFLIGGTMVKGHWLTQGGRVLMVALAGGRLRALDLFTGAALGPDLDYGGNFEAAAHTRDGRMLAAGYADGQVLLWKAPPLPLVPPLLDKMDKDKLKDLWAVLARSDAQQAYAAHWQLCAARKQTLLLLHNELRPAPAVAAKQIAAWIAQLDSTSFKERTLAMRELEYVGDVAGAALSKVLEQKPSLEMRKRIEILLAKLTSPPSGETLRSLRAIVILTAIGGDKARAILRTLAEGAPGARVTEAARAALKRM
jgi:WD40 repeat protein